MNKTLTMILLAASASAGAHELMARQSGDLGANMVVATPQVAHSFGAPTTRREPVAMSWAFDAAIAPAAPHVAASREYYFEASGDQLAAGVALHTTAPRALVRLQPLQAASPREAVAIDPQALLIIDASRRVHAAGAGMQLLVGADKLAKADLPFAPGTSAFRLHPDLGAGSFTLKAEGLHGDARYLVNVVEPGSPLVLTLQADASAYLHGHTLVLEPALEERAGAVLRRKHAIGKLDGVLVSPAGRRFELSFKPGKDGSLRARLPLDADEAPAPGLWEVQANASAKAGDQVVLRSVRLALAVAMPVARLTGAVALAPTADTLGLALGVEAAASGRYEVRGLLYGMVSGSMAPLGVAHAAQWMDAGSHNIVLGFDHALLGGASAPFELRDLQLLDQGRMGVLHRQQQALRLDERDVGRSGKTLVRPALRPKLPPSTQG